MADRYGMQIRTATPADAPGLAELLGRAGHRLSAGTVAERLDGLRTGQGTVLIALDAGPPSGLVVVNWVRTLWSDHALAQVSALLVDPGERRRGIARLLVKAAAQGARSAGCRSLQLLVRGPDAALPAFARATGFDETGTIFCRPLRKGRAREEAPDDRLGARR